jgi:hypothetical protein
MAGSIGSMHHRAMKLGRLIDRETLGSKMLHGLKEQSFPLASAIALRLAVRNRKSGRRERRGKG